MGNNFTTCLTCCEHNPPPSSSSYPSGEYITAAAEIAPPPSSLLYPMLIFTHCKCLYYRRSGIGRVFFYLSLSLFRYVYPRAISKWKVLIGPLTFFFLFSIFFFFGPTPIEGKRFFSVTRQTQTSHGIRQTAESRKKKRERYFRSNCIPYCFIIFFLLLSCSVASCV